MIQVLLGKPVLMPPTGRLDSETVNALAEWIRMGAPWPAEQAVEERAAGSFDLDARRRAHWAWRPVRNVAPPEVRDAAWSANPVDRFILAKLEENGLRPAAPADRRTLVRRISFDLTGLPPTPGEIEEYLRDESPGAYARLVRRMLASERFGERWARHWMDLVRYADSHGSEGDPKVTGAWQYRDYLVRALNADVPYDQLIREHLAGDLVEPPRIDRGRNINESILGTAHLRVVELGYQPVDPWEERVKWTDNQIEVLSKAFQGLTVSCARCHDHKFDAISQEDYYALFGILYGARPTMRTVDSPDVLHRNEAGLLELKDRIREKVARAWIEEAADLGRRIWRGEDPAVKRVLEEAACDEASPLHAWMTLVDQDEDEFGEAWNRLRIDWERRIESRAAFNRENFDGIWDLSGADYADWISHGTGTRETPSPPGEFHVRHEGDRVLEGIYPGGAYTHLLTTKHAGVMQSPRFEIESDYISVKVLGGDFSFARLIVENYPLPGGGIYHQRYSPPQRHHAVVSVEDRILEGLHRLHRVHHTRGLHEFCSGPDRQQEEASPRTADARTVRDRSGGRRLPRRGNRAASNPSSLCSSFLTPKVRRPLPICLDSWRGNSRPSRKPGARAVSTSGRRRSWITSCEGACCREQPRRLQASDLSLGNTGGWSRKSPCPGDSRGSLKRVPPPSRS